MARREVIVLLIMPMRAVAVQHLVDYGDAAMEHARHE
jgi:hypothetical protein